jgi:transformation/transcription domain-associated protein
VIVPNFLTLDAEIRFEAAIQLSNNIEHYVSGPTYAKFLKKLVPIFNNCLKGPPVFIDTSPEQVEVPCSNY